MNLDDEIARSRRLVERHWPFIATHCPDPRLHGSILQPVEGMNGHRALDLDRRSHIDYHAAVRGRGWTPLSTRFQSAAYAEKRTVTFRCTEVRHLRSMISDGTQIGADVHVQMYGDDEALDFVVIAELEPVAQYFAGSPDHYLFWQHAPDNTPFTCLTRAKLRALVALIWAVDPRHDEQLELAL